MKQKKIAVGEKVFVYGTLRLGERNDHWIGEDGKYTEEATLQGAAMYNIGAFPGLKLEGKGVVFGELVEAVTPRLSDQLDRLEGYPGMYDRKVVETSHGKAWVYTFNYPTPEATKIHSGDWKKRM